MQTDPNPKAIRRQRLLDLIERQGYLRLADAAQELDVSEQTVRRDVKALDKLGKVRRTHGGASFVGALDSETYQKRRHSQAEEKNSVAQRIADLIPDGASIFLDSGTTCEAVANALLKRRNLRVVTYSIRCASQFSDRSDFVVAIPGGFVRHIDGAIIGPQDDGFIEQFMFDYAVIAVSGLDHKGRLSDDDAFEVNRVRAAMGKAQETILALTSDKIGVSALVNLANFDEISCAVVEREPNPVLEQLAQRNDVRLVYAS
ncbi:MAG: DeoR/GlpR family DNA-binding transcription regulator [Pelagimonas sp.]|nr:DeoR/GlpR family DNA-binding transcription regulator [Pelagimonas sp.]